jgi:predicted Zn-dependent protease
MGLFGRSYGSQRGGAGKIRFVIAAFLAIGALVTYWSRRETNPITGETQSVAMKPDQEIRLGLAAVPELAKQMGGALDPRTDQDAARVAAMGRKLVDTYKARQSPYVKDFNFYLLSDTRTVNAFALPGGQIFITRALYNQLENEAQLAGVLGHEIGHVLHRHGSEHMAKGELGQGLVGAAAVGSGDYSVASAANAANQMLQLKYGRGDELESDAWGLENMAAAGYHPREMVTVMEVLKRASGGGSQKGSLFSTHPDPDYRMEVIKSYIAKKWPDGAADLGAGAKLR